MGPRMVELYGHCWETLCTALHANVQPCLCATLCLDSVLAFFPMQERYCLNISFSR